MTNEPRMFPAVGQKIGIISRWRYIYLWLLPTKIMLLNGVKMRYKEGRNGRVYVLDIRVDIQSFSAKEMYK